MQSLYPPSLRAMTTHFPWAWLMAHGEKSEEYRSRLINFRGLCLLHAGRSKDSDDALYKYNIPKSEIVRGAILGAATFTGAEWNGDCFAYTLENPIHFPEPFPCKGKLPIFWQATTSDQIEAFAQAWAYLKGRSE